MENKDKQKITSVIESILFVSGSAITRTDITEKLNITTKELDEAIKDLKKKYDATSGIQLLCFSDKIQFSSKSENATEVAIVLNPIRERALTKATLETLSIVAYKQPVTRLDVEEIRGVNSDYAISILLDHKLIEVVGRKDAVGKPLLFGTTDEFLKRFNLSAITDLPEKESLMERIKTINTRPESEGLYHDFEISSEEIIPESIKRAVERASAVDPDSDPHEDKFV